MGVGERGARVKGGRWLGKGVRSHPSESGSSGPGAQSRGSETALSWAVRGDRMGPSAWPQVPPDETIP